MENTLGNFHGFELVKEQEIPEINTTGRLFRHIATGAQLLSMVNDDENKVFGITFRTTPQDSTGVAHILEHAVLNGSEKYPVKEPFVELIKGSLQTFVNAFTFPDKTCYPCASQNLQDFYNLVDVYIDAVFHPLIPPHILDQEGWHLGMDEESGNLIYKGVVFNEMKGALSDPNGLLEEISQQSLFPDNLYRHNSGGDPRNIPDLTYEQFKQFHETYYHPSNAYVFWYGDDPEEERLKKMAAYLEGYSYLEVDSVIPLQEPFEETLHLTEPYAVGEEEEPKYYVSVNWVLDEQTDPEKVLGLGILNHILVGTQASPLRKALIDSGYGEDLVGGGLGSYLRQLTFSTGLKGMLEENTTKVEELIFETLTRLVKNGIDPNMLAASMNSVEFQLRERNTGSFPRGIGLMLSALTTWQYGGDPFSPMAFEAPLAAIKARLADGKTYFESLIQTYLLDNSHRSTVILEPDPDHNRHLAEDEKSRLTAIQEAFGSQELQAVVDHEKKLIEIQETPDTPEALATLPTLALEDLDKHNKTIPLEVLEEEGVTVLYHDLFTNGIAYFDLSFDLCGVPQDLLPYLSLFASGLVKMGTDREDFVQLSQRIGRETGGISPSLLIQNKFNTDEVISRLVVRGKSTMNQVGEMLAIMEDILLTTQYDNQDRFRQILTERKARKEASLVPGGHRVVDQRLSASHSAAGWLAEQTGGIENLFFSRQLLKQIEDDWDSVAEKFTQIRELVVNRQTMMLNVTLDQKNWPQARKHLSDFFNTIPLKNVPAQVWEIRRPVPAEGLTIPAQINYVGKGANIYKLGFQPDGSINVIRKYLGTTYIWEKIRVQGGAYGGFISFDLYSGAFNFISYRDPHVINTLENYDGTAGFLRRLELADSELVKSIIGTIGDMDSYQLPDAKGYTSMLRYLAGYSDQARQEIREQVLSTSVEDFKALANVLDELAQNGVIAVLGSADAIAKANQERNGFLTVRTAL
ncbi:MAG: insulinase family protein [Anaerolineales bacterium]|nr:insulinase family protein [Anaerolineales bacterium]